MNEINYSISFQKPYTHYCEVEISLSDPDQDTIVFSMPVWTPGSYLIREFSKNVENVTANNSKDEKLPVEKINKNSWSISAKNQRDVKLKYKVYCNDFTVRTSAINSEHAFISNAGVFMMARGFEDKKCVLNINLPDEWKKISTGLTNESENIYSAENYDIFIDSPIEIGNQNILEFDIKEVKHYISLSGKGNYKDELLIKDFKKIAEEEIKLFGGEIPYKNYTFIIHLVQKGGGGLEHLNSFVGQANRWIFNDEKLYKKFLALVSHEFFHLWNVKRIRPSALGPFDYNNENYTKSLWIAEGWTSFYDNLILRRTEILDNQEYFNFLDIGINDIMKFKGRFNQSLTESSFDTWIKFYRKDENYNNSQVSYYTKGALVALMLDIEIIKNTNAEKSLDDALRILYEDYKKDNSKGYTEERVMEICEFVCGKNLSSFWEKYITGAEELPLGSYLNDCGLKLVNENDSAQTVLDIETKEDNGKYIVTKVFDGGSAYESGINSNDEIIAVNGVRMDLSLMSNFLKGYSEGDELKILISRTGIINEIKVKLLKPIPKYKIVEIENKSAEQQKNLDKWLFG
ncbi:MAG: PDZ domain-containing protein [bacterium]